MADELTKKRNDNRSDDISWGRLVLRLIGVAIVLAVTAFLTPGFTVDGIGALILAAIIITAVNYLLEKFTGIDASPFGRGIVGFIVSVLIIYFTQYFVGGFAVTLLGAIIGAVVIGIIDAIVPGRVM
jgi:hypothetical protein